eukprot:m.202576 g.202576  ORF g.202576 m.202576 type:complete len:50 (-) comp15365_c2_seq1:5186-5335(-)
MAHMSLHMNGLYACCFIGFGVATNQISGHDTRLVALFTARYSFMRTANC